MQWLTLNYELDLEPSSVKHAHCTSTHHTWHLCQVIWKSDQGFKRYRVDMKAWLTIRQITELKTICLPIFRGGGRHKETTQASLQWCLVKNQEMVSEVVVKMTNNNNQVTKLTISSLYSIKLERWLFTTVNIFNQAILQYTILNAKSYTFNYFTYAATCRTSLFEWQLLVNAFCTEAMSTHKCLGIGYVVHADNTTRIPFIFVRSMLKNLFSFFNLLLTFVIYN